MKHTRIAITLLGMTIGATGIACGDSLPGPEAADDAQWLAFKASTTIISEEGDVPTIYLFDGDMVAVGESGLYREYLRYFGPPTVDGEGPTEGIATTGSALTVDNVDGVDELLPETSDDSEGGRFDLTYCIERDTFSAAQLAALIPTLDVAARSWSNLINVQFRYVGVEDSRCNEDNRDVFFNVRGANLSGATASAFFPEFDRNTRELLVDDIAFTTTLGGRDLDGILRHEFGHILGFRHEHIWIGCTSENVGSGRQVTAYDVNSVMHNPGCRPSNGGGYRQSPFDYQGAIELYGIAPALLVAMS